MKDAWHLIALSLSKKRGRGYNKAIAEGKHLAKMQFNEQNGTFLSLLMHMGWSSWCRLDANSHLEFKRRIECKLLPYLAKFLFLDSPTSPLLAL